MTEISPFEYVKSISETKNKLDDLSGYNSFLTNRALSLNIDCLMDSNIMNIFHNLPVNMQYDFYMNSIRKMKRYGKKWPKPTIDNDVDMISQYFKYSKDKAKAALNILTSDNLETIRRLLDKGGVQK